MTVQTFFQQSIDVNAGDMRELVKVLLLPGRDGVLLTGGPAPLQVSAHSTPDMGVAFAAGWAKKSGYVAHADADDLTFLDADPALPRIDTVVLRWYDTELGDGTSRGAVEVLEGTPNGSPAAPSTAGMVVVPLADVYIAAATSSIAAGNITDRRVLASATDLGHAEYQQSFAMSLNNDNTLKTLAGMVAVIDTLGLSPVSGALTITTAGWYKLSACIVTDDGGTTIAGYFVNNIAVVGNRVPDSNAAYNVVPLPEKLVWLNVGDVVNLQARHSAAGKHTIVTATGYVSFLRLELVG